MNLLFIIEAMWAGYFSKALNLPGRFSHNSIINNNEIWIIGGAEKPLFNNRTCAEDASGPISLGNWKYNLNNNNWRYEYTPFKPRRAATLVNNKDKTYLHGGGIVDINIPFRSIPLSDMWEYDNGIWRKIHTNNPDIYNHASIITDKGYIYSLGGLDKEGRSKYLYIYDGKIWRKQNTPFSLTGILGHTMNLVDNRLIYVIGGVFGNPTEKDEYNKDVWVYDIINNRWNVECGSMQLQGHCSNVYNKIITFHGQDFNDDEIIVTGGFYPTNDEVNDEGATHLGGTTDGIFLFSTRKKTWKKIGVMDKPREFHSSVIIDNRLFIYGGYHIGNFWNDGEIIWLS